MYKFIDRIYIKDSYNYKNIIIIKIINFIIFIITIFIFFKINNFLYFLVKLYILNINNYI